MGTWTGATQDTSATAVSGSSRYKVMSIESLGDGGSDGSAVNGAGGTTPQLPFLLKASVVKGFGRGSKLLGIPTGKMWPSFNSRRGAGKSLPISTMSLCLVFTCSHRGDLGPDFPGRILS